MRLPLAAIATVLLTCASPLGAQEKVYKIEFDIHADDGAHTQHLSISLDESKKGILQAAVRIPIAPDLPGYVDTGVKIECAVRESDGKVDLHGDIKLTNITGQVSISGISQPIIGEKRIRFERILELGRRTVVVSPSSPTPKIEAAVTRIN